MLRDVMLPFGYVGSEHATVFILPETLVNDNVESCQELEHRSGEGVAAQRGADEHGTIAKTQRLALSVFIKQSIKLKELHKNQEQTDFFATVFLAIDVCHCASLFCLPGVEETSGADDEVTPAAPLPRRCFSLRALLDQSKNRRWRPDMLRLSNVVW